MTSAFSRREAFSREGHFPSLAEHMGLLGPPVSLRRSLQQPVSATPSGRRASRCLCVPGSSEDSDVFECISSPPKAQGRSLRRDKG